MLFIYRVINNLSPNLVADSFKEKNTKYTLCSKSTLQLPSTCNTNRLSNNSVIFKGRIIWNHLSNIYKEASSDNVFKERIKNWRPEVCTCNICK